jgi:uncharacterized membrane protein
MKRRTNQVIQLLIRRWWIVIGIAMLASLALTLSLGKGQDIWFDENYSITLAQQPIGELLRLTGVDAHPPLFYILLKGWGSLFGWTELSLRMMSALLAASTVGIVALIVRRLFTTRVALAVLPFLVLTPFWLRYGYEVRMYALAGLIGALASLVLLKAVDSKGDRRWWALYGALVALGMYTLYMTAVIWIAHFVWLMIYRHKHFWRQPWFLSYIFAVVLFLPYISTAITQYTNSALPGIGWTLNLTHINEVISMLLIYTPEWSVVGWSALAVISIVALTIYLLDRVRHQMTPSSRRALSFMIVLALVPPIFFVLVSLPMSEPFFLPRYLAHTSLFIYALVGVAVALGWQYRYRKASVVLGVLSLSMLAWGVGQLSQAGNFNYERMQRPETTLVREQIDCSKSVIVADDQYTYINDVYYFQGCDLRFYSEHPVWYWGGYAPLVAKSNERLAKSTDLTTERLVHLYWSNSDQTFHPDSRYKLVSSTRHDLQVTDTYELRTD